MTRLGLLNRIFFQWLFIRLTAHSRKDHKGEWRHYYWSLNYFVVPTTGWKTEFKFLGKSKFFRLTKPKISVDEAMEKIKKEMQNAK